MTESNIHFEPQKVADWFAEIIQLPHESGKEDPLRAAVFKWLTDPSYGIGLSPENVYYQGTATDPGKRVIHAFRPGTGNLKPIILQAHMDMVVVTEPKVDNPFPLQPYYDPEGWLKARACGSGDVRSTLGADDGIGIATALALLQEPDLKDYPIECLFTVQEETDMGGAEFFDTALLKGRTYINLDDERAGTITYGSAGGFKTVYQGTIQRESMSPAPSFVKIVLGGLRGGHSGVDIAKGRPSALKLLVEGLCYTDRRIDDFTLPAGVPPESYDFRLVSLARTDVIKSNAIPTEATAVVAVAAADADPLINTFQQWFSALKILYGASEPNLRIQLDLVEPPGEDPLSPDATDNLLCFLRLVPQGVMRVIPGYDPAVVETSSNVYDVRLDSAMMTVETSTRTSNPVLLGTVEVHGHTPLNEMFIELGATYGLTVETAVDDWYPAWPPNRDSHLLAMAKQVWTSVYPDPQVSVIHAGLECGWIVSRCGDMDCIAVGPTIQNPHTIDERLDTSSVKNFYAAVKGLMLALYKEQGVPQPTGEEKVAEEALASVAG